MNKEKLIEKYKRNLKDDEILLLKSKDNFLNSHYVGSMLNVFTNFSGSAGEAILDSNGKIQLFVDPRYHLMSEKQVFSNIEICKMELGETFFDSFKKKYKKNTKFYVPDDILLKDYLELDNYFELRTYKTSKSDFKNFNLKSNKKPYLIDKKIEKNDFSFKISKIKKIYHSINKMVIFDLDEIAYLTNLRSFQFENSSLFQSYLYLDFKNSEYILFVDKFKNDNKIADLKIESLSKFDNFIKSIDDEIYLDSSKISLKNYLLFKNPKHIKKDKISVLASIKSKNTIEYLHECNSKIDKVLLNFKNKLKKGLSEVDLVNIFLEEIRKVNAKTISFIPIIAINENSASIHYSISDKNKILNGEDIVLIDCGVYFEGGFATDITRTFYFGNNPKKIHKTIYTNVLKAFVSCFISDAKEAKVLDNLSRELLKDSQILGFSFNHGLGHGIGTSVHQNPPVLSVKTKDRIKPYQVHSIEPGLYGKNSENNAEFGVRIENCVYFDLNYQRHSLSKFPFEELLIDYNMLSEEEKTFIKNWNNQTI